jgi:hypothetical protein
MGNPDRHARVARQNREGAVDEFQKKRFVNVALLSLRTFEQAIESCAAKENLHFHQYPKTAHANRRDWLKRNHTDLLDVWEELWIIYGALGYNGVDGDRAKRAIKILNKALKILQEREGVNFGV